MTRSTRHNARPATPPGVRRATNPLRGGASASLHSDITPGQILPRCAASLSSHPQTLTKTHRQGGWF